MARRRCLNGSTISVQAPIQDARLAARGYQINLHCHFTHASLRPTRWRKLYYARKRTDLALLPSFRHVRHLQYTNFMLQVRNDATRLGTGVCEALLLDVVASEAHQDDCSYVRELSGPTFSSPYKNLAWWAVSLRTSKNHKTVKIGGWALAWGWVLARDNMVLTNWVTKENTVNLD